MKHLTKFLLFALLLISALSAEQLGIKGNPVPLTDAGEIYMSPQWSPDGSKLAVTGPHFRGISVIDFPGGGMQSLTTAASAGLSMIWTQDGHSIISNVDRYDGRWRYTRTVKFNTDGSQQDLNPEQKRLYGKPILSKSGDVIYLHSKKEIKAFPLTRNSLQKPAGLSSAAQQELNTYKSQSDMITEALNVDGARVIDVDVSPSGKQITYATIGEKLWIVDVDGQNRRFLGRGTGPKWSPDEKWIACMVTEDDGHNFTRSDIWMYHAATGSVHEFTTSQDNHEMNPVWSPDGKWIAYDTVQDGRVWVVEVEAK